MPGILFDHFKNVVYRCLFTFEQLVKRAFSIEEQTRHVVLGIGGSCDAQQRNEIFLSEVLGFCADVAQMKDSIFRCFRAAILCVGVFLGHII